MFTKPRGTQDILPNEAYTWQDLEYIIREVSSVFNFEEIRTPIFESTELFHRTAGETSDIVQKETYDFLDRANRSNTLRPEGTASVVRSFIENKLYALPGAKKLYYVGPMFRYENPQKGRQRQFHQFGAELLGVTSPLGDAEMISYAYNLIKALKLPGVKVHINSLGDKESKENYKNALREYLADKIDGLCYDCRQRYNTNPLRILDCKVDASNEIFKNIPKPVDYLTLEDRKHFDDVLNYLNLMNIPYEVDNMLVRGLDYYTHTVFEIKSDLAILGNASTIGGGGRYNNLVKELGGPETGAVGFAFGLERLVIAMNEINTQKFENYIHLFVIALGERAHLKACELVAFGRSHGLTCEMEYNQGSSLKSQFKSSERLNASYIVILGDNELDNNLAKLKNTKTKEEIETSVDGVFKTLVKDIRKSQAHSCGGCQGGCHEEN